MLGNSYESCPDKSKRKHRKSHGKVGFADMARIISQKWKTLDPALKKQLQDQAAKNKAEYLAAVKEFRSKKNKHTSLLDQKRPMSPRTHESAAVLASLGVGGAPPPASAVAPVARSPLRGPAMVQPPTMVQPPQPAPPMQPMQPPQAQYVVVMQQPHMQHPYAAPAPGGMPVFYQSGPPAHPMAMPPHHVAPNQHVVHQQFHAAQQQKQMFAARQAAAAQQHALAMQQAAFQQQPTASVGPAVPISPTATPQKPEQSPSPVNPSKQPATEAQSPAEPAAEKQPEKHSEGRDQATETPAKAPATAAVETPQPRHPQAVSPVPPPQKNMSAPQRPPTHPAVPGSPVGPQYQQYPMQYHPAQQPAFVAGAPFMMPQQYTPMRPGFASPQVVVVTPDGRPLPQHPSQQPLVLVQHPSGQLTYAGAAPPRYM